MAADEFNRKANEDNARMISKAIQQTGTGTSAAINEQTVQIKNSTEEIVECLKDLIEAIKDIDD